MVLCHPGCQEMRIFQDVDDDYADDDDEGGVISKYRYVLKKKLVFNSDAVL